MNDILFGNNNKAVIKKLANRSFRSNKMRNVIAVIAIALTTFLFTAVLTIGMGASGTLEYSMAKLMGSSADALVQGLSEEQFQQLKQNAMFEKVVRAIAMTAITFRILLLRKLRFASFLMTALLLLPNRM